MPNDLTILISFLPRDLQRVVWCEYIDRLRVRMLHYQLSRKFCRWRSLHMPTHTGMFPPITEYHIVDYQSFEVPCALFSDSGWAKDGWHENEYYAVPLDCCDTLGDPRVRRYLPLSLNPDGYQSVWVHASFWYDPECEKYYDPREQRVLRIPK